MAIHSPHHDKGYDCACEPCRFSSSVSRALSSLISLWSLGSWAKIADDLSQSLLSIAGYPDMTFPASTEFGMPVWAVAITLSPISRCPAAPTCPLKMTSLPTRVLPARPTCAHNRVFWPTYEP